MTPGTGKNLWHCLGACQAGGSVIDWVMRVERVSFRHAVERLRTQGGGGPAAPPPMLAPLATRAAKETAHVRGSGRAPGGETGAVGSESVDRADGALLRDVIAFYHETLKASPEAIDYLESRGLNSVALIDRFQLGFANRTLGYRLPAKTLKAGAAVRGQLQRLGILRGSGHEHFTGSVVVPILGERGQVVQCYGRKITPRLREGTPLHLYLPGAHTAVWNVDALADAKEIILCESLIDAMTFWVAGFPNVITSYGVSGFTEAHRAALRRYGTERVLIAYDADEAGERAAERVAEVLALMGIEGYRVHFPRGLDANAYALAEASNAPARESLGALLRGATWLGRPAPLAGAASSATVTSPAPSSLAAALPSAAAAVAAPEPVTAPSASPVVSAAPTPALTVERRGDDVHATGGIAGDRRYRVRGLTKNLSPDALRVNLLVERGAALHVDTLDLYVARARTLFIAQAAKELGVSEETVKRDVGALILALESLVAEQIAGVLAPVPTEAPDASTMSETERAAALALLRIPGSWTASSPTSSAPGWWARRRTSSWGISRPSRGNCPSRSR